jgi:hypothetical protein
MKVVAVAGLMSVASLAPATELGDASRGNRAPARRAAPAAASRRPAARVAAASPRKTAGTVPATVALLMLVGAGPKGR